jgi:ABC-type phosphate transport system substrate-binding protein
MRSETKETGPLMRGIQLLLALAAMGAYGANVQPEEIKIIANPNVEASEISRDDLNRIFLMTKTSLAGASHVEPVLEKGGAICDLFSRKYIGRTNAALMTYYRGLMFTGKAAIPKSFDSDSEVAEFVAKTKGAIGYVSITANTAGVKTLKVK